MTPQNKYKRYKKLGAKVEPTKAKPKPKGKPVRKGKVKWMMSHF